MSSVSTRSSKRRRQEKTEGTAWAQHSEFWLDDGNVVLVCGDVGFLVTRSPLALNSPVFGDIFKELGPTTERHDDIPVVRLDDAADDMYHLLKALHFRQYAAWSSEPSYGVLASILRLSTKYQVTSLRQEAIDILSAILPSTLSGWNDKSIQYTPNDMDAMHAVQLAKELSIPAILPAAFYLSALLPPRRVLDPNSSVASWETRNACIIFRDDLMGAISDLMNDSVTDPDFPWKSRSKCHWLCLTRACKFVDDKYKRDIETTFRRLTPGDIFDSTLGLKTDGSICVLCCERMDRYYRGMQIKIWNVLPTLCGFEGWADVSAQAGEALVS